MNVLHNSRIASNVLSVMPYLCSLIYLPRFFRQLLIQFPWCLSDCRLFHLGWFQFVPWVFSELLSPLNNFCILHFLQSGSRQNAATRNSFDKGLYRFHKCLNAYNVRSGLIFLFLIFHVWINSFSEIFLYTYENSFSATLRTKSGAINRYSWWILISHRLCLKGRFVIFLASRLIILLTFYSTNLWFLYCCFILQLYKLAQFS